MNKILRLIICIVICQAAGGIGSIFTAPAIATWYASLVKPAFSPPNWLFAPVWITLFLLMGISLYLVWNKGLDKRKNRVAVYFFAGQLILNILWSVMFFGLQSPLLGFIEIIILWIAIALTIIKFYKVDKRAAWIMVPYIVWVTIASALNLYIWLLN